MEIRIRNFLGVVEADIPLDSTPVVVTARTPAGRRRSRAPSAACWLATPTRSAWPARSGATSTTLPTMAKSP